MHHLSPGDAVDCLAAGQRVTVSEVARHDGKWSPSIWQTDPGSINRAEQLNHICNNIDKKTFFNAVAAV